MGKVIVLDIDARVCVVVPGFLIAHVQCDVQQSMPYTLIRLLETKARVFHCSIGQTA
jgi:hypothetical protein